MSISSPYATLVFLLFSTTLFCRQSTFKPTTPPNVHIKKAVSKITLDGKLDEADWHRAEQTSPFWESIPYDTSYAITKTEVRITFDDNNLYIGAKCYQKKSSYIVQSLRRDFPPGSTDLFGLILDPFCDKQNGFSFVISPMGVQREGLISNGGVDGVTTIWDQVWQSETHFENGAWTAELAIPFRSLRYNPNLTTWGVNFARQDLKRNEQSAWSAIPRS